MLKMLRQWTSVFLILIFVTMTLSPLVYALNIQTPVENIQQNAHNPHHCHDASNPEQKIIKHCPTQKSCCGTSICHCSINNCHSIFLTPLLNSPAFPSIFTRLSPFNAEKLPSKIVNTIERPPKSRFIVA